MKFRAQIRYVTTTRCSGDCGIYYRLSGIEDLGFEGSALVGFFIWGCAASPGFQAKKRSHFKSPRELEHIYLYHSTHCTLDHCSEICEMMVMHCSTHSIVSVVLIPMARVRDVSTFNEFIDIPIFHFPYGSCLFWIETVS